uniref:Uncharacterized protein n=2 Tax=Gelidium TaxID=2811 RepID=A0A411FSV2_9FLOR|nr:hypothetical protein [Gelidium coulteri]YP_009565294.1 hypothetical protein [Gelidium sinicola]QBA96245.1 hypothetical protein [Gelidium coulteri]QBA96645.1 hypothetical protein [Gelidium sinicola]
MTRLWPTNSGTDLNNEVAYLFFNIKNKFSNNLANYTSFSLYTDLLNIRSKQVLFESFLDELEILILDIVELNLSPENLKALNYKIVCDLIKKSKKRFLESLVDTKSILKKYTPLNLFTEDNYLSLIISEYKIIFQKLLIYIVFGSSAIQDNTLGFTCTSTPSSYVAILLETSLIQLSNLVLYLVLDSCTSLLQISAFLNEYKLCNPCYLSIRSLAYFKNALTYQNLIYLYIDYPKSIYNSRYRVLLISSHGIIAKYIYSSRFEDMINLSTGQFFTILFIEIQDLIIPKLEEILLILGKIILYIFINLCSNSFILIIKIITSRLYTREE